MKLVDILIKAGFRGEALRMAYAIAMAESSGNARAHNPNAGTGDNSYGLFQINMLGAMGPERRRQYGLKSNEDLFDPLVNARVAYKMSNGGRNWRPWSTYGNGMYTRFYGGSGASVSNSDSGGYWTGSGYASGGSTAAVKPKLDMEELAERFGLSASLINSNPELKKLFQQTISGGWSDAKFNAHLKNTKWWQTQSSTLRKYITLKFVDPATWTQNRKAAMYKLNQIAVQVGLGNQIRADGTPTRLLDAAMYNSLALGWADQRLKDWFGARVDLNGDLVGGEAGEAWDKLHELTYVNGVKFSTTWMKNNTRSVITGKSTMQTLEDYIRKTAAARYSAYADQIKAGMNVMDLAAPYIKATAGILELPESDVDLFNTHVAKAMSSKPGPGEGAGGQMPLWQFETELRSDPLWRKTNNARESMMSVARQVAKDFGMAY